MPGAAAHGGGGCRRLRRRRWLKGSSTAAAKVSGVATDSAARDGHVEPISETRHIWDLSDLDPLLLASCPDATHAARKVLGSVWFASIKFNSCHIECLNTYI